MDLAQTNIGSEGKLAVSVNGGKIGLTFTDTHASGTVSLSVSEDLKYFLELLKPHLPAYGVAIVSVVEGSLP